MTSSFPQQWQERYTAGEADVCAWFPCSLDDVTGHARKRSDLRPLADADHDEWRAFLAPHNPPAPVLENLERLREAGARVVVTGQQAGLFGGPLYTIYKAIGAIRWARRLERELDAPVVPIFWIASDDHDFDEVAWHKWLDRDGAVQNWQAAAKPEENGRPLFARTIDTGEIDAFAARLEQTTAPGDHRDHIVAFLRRLAARAPVTWEAQFAACLVEWLGREGLVPFAPRMNWFRRRSIPIIERELRDSPATSGVLVRRGDGLAAAGGKGFALHRSGNEANVFVHEQGLRCKVVCDGGKFQIINPTDNSLISTVDREAMIERLHARPEDFSPNAALRPVVQDAALPTLAYIGGPAELVYHAQIAPLYESFGVFRPAVVPRPSAVLVEPRIRRHLDKLGLDAAKVLKRGTESVREAAARAGDPGHLRERIEDLLGGAKASLGAIAELLAEETGDTALRKASGRLAESVDSQAEQLRNRLDAWLARRHDDIARQAGAITAAFWPDGMPQERTLGALAPLWRTIGPGGFAKLVEGLREDYYEMQITEL